MLRKDFFLNTITKWLVQSVIYSLYFDTFNVSLKKKKKNSTGSFIILY